MLCENIKNLGYFEPSHRDVLKSSLRFTDSLRFEDLFIMPRLLQDRESELPVCHVQ